MLNLFKSRYFYIFMGCIVLLGSYLLFDLKGLFGSLALVLGLTKRQYDVTNKDEDLKKKSDDIKSDLNKLDKQKKDLKKDDKQLTDKETVDYWKDQ